MVKHACRTWRLGKCLEMVDGKVGRKLPPSPVQGDEALDALCPELIALHVSLGELEHWVIVPAMLVVPPLLKGLTTI